MPIQNELGFLETDFLLEDFGAGQVGWFEGSQVLMKILDETHAQKSQVNMNVISGHAQKAQVNMNITSSSELGAQVSIKITDFLNNIGGQVNMNIQGTTSIVGSQLTTTNMLYFSCEGFLEGGFLEGDFLSHALCAAMRSQVDMIVNETVPVGAQVNMKIESGDDGKSQAIMVVETSVNLGSQVTLKKIESLHSQVTIALYNTNRPRILCDFASRGTTGENWTSSSTEPGDFSVFNLNNDIEEMYWRSATNNISGITLTCDTEIAQGIFMDTFAIRNHNLTTSATVTLQASNDANFSPVDLTIGLTVREHNIYYIAPDLPTESFRYWRILIADGTNQNDHLRIGTIVFGNARIFNSESTTNEITEIPREFKDSFKTDGFTSVANSRALKDSLRVTFDKLAYESGDYTKLLDIIKYARTTLKCLWIFDPANQNRIHRFSVFGKIKSIPQRRHRVIGSGNNEDHITMSLEVDESE